MSNIKKEISKYFSKLAKDRHKKSPKPREYYQEIGKKSWSTRKNLSTSE